MTAGSTRPSSAGASGRTEGAPYAGLVRMGAVAVGFGALTLVVSHQVGVPLRDPHGAWFVRRLAITVLGCVVLALGDAAVRSRRRGLPLRGAPHLLRERWTRARSTTAVAALLAYHAVYFCYHNLKSWVVFQQPRDDLLERWDRAIFLGHSPAVLLHDVLGQGVAAVVLTAVYVSFSTVVILTVVSSVVLPEQVRDGLVFLASAMWMWILGTGSYWLIPSLGPFAHSPEEFSGLTRTQIQDTQDKYVAQRAHLLADPGASDATAQIAAFASLHVAMVCLVWLFVRRQRLRVISVLLGVDLVGTVLATVYLGWHYSLDVVAGLVIAILAWSLGQLTVGAGRGTPDVGLRWASRGSNPEPAD